MLGCFKSLIGMLGVSETSRIKEIFEEDSSLMLLPAAGMAE